MGGNSALIKKKGFLQRILLFHASLSYTCQFLSRENGIEITNVNSENNVICRAVGHTGLNISI